MMLSRFRFSSLFALLFAVLLVQPATAHPAKLSAADRQRLVHDSFRTVTAISLIPLAVQKAFAEAAKDSHFDMANPGQPFQVTDVIMKPGLPSRRLIFAGLGKSYCILHYEYGGIATGEVVAVFQLSKRSPVLIWRGLPRRHLLGISDLKQELQHNKIQEVDSDFL